MSGAASMKLMTIALETEKRQERGKTDSRSSILDEISGVPFYSAIFCSPPSVISPQAMVLQRPDIMLGPRHGSPLTFGSGLLHTRFLVPTPPLQLALHAHGPHSDQPPSSGSPSMSVARKIEISAFLHNKKSNL